jgi:hypothetical protein
MKKSGLGAIALLLATSAPVLAETQSWNVTEEGTTGIKTFQGTWAVTTTDGKISGKASMQSNTGAMQTYTFTGDVKDNAYTVKLEGREDGKSGCTWTGKPRVEDGKAKGLVGDVACEKGGAFKIRAGF